MERRTLIIEGGPEAETVTLRERHGRLEVDLGDERFEVERGRFDRVQVDLGEELDTLVFEGSDVGDWLDLSRPATGSGSPAGGTTSRRARRRR